MSRPLSRLRGTAWRARVRRRAGPALVALVLAGLAVLALSAPPARAHPHAWIDLSTTVLFDGEGRVAALRVHWVFDEFYTLYAIEDFDADGDGKPDPDQLRELAKVNMKGLSEYDYFTYLKVDGVQPAYDPAVDFETYMEDERLAMTFTVALLVPADPRRSSVSYAVYDPTYYIEIAHTGGEPVRFEGAAPEGCTYQLQYPDPDDEMALFAANLDQTQSAGDGLGAFFAEHVAILCP